MTEQLDDEPDEEPRDAGPSDRWEDELMEGHEYAGIREYDNPIPGWLSLLFIGTIVWSVFYLVASSLGYVDDYEDRLEEGQRALAEMRQEAQAQQKEITESLLADAAKEEKRASKGREVFANKCANCHEQNGGGKIGPNLTDEYWIHGGSLTSVYETISEGVQSNGMPPWKDRLSQDQRINLVAYIESLETVEPPQGKKPEGDKYEPEES